jgi:hypothetical protein
MILNPGIAAFDDWVLSHIGTAIKGPAADDSINRSEFMPTPKFEKTYDNGKP